jgi:3-hydroxyacyl-[acyl-carrier-protein] dehydratase
VSLPYLASPPYAAPLRAVDSSRVQAQGDRLLITATKSVVDTDPYLAAHFPGHTVYPGVFIVEGVQQAVVAVLGPRDGVLPELSAVHSLRFLGAMHPGECLCIVATVEPADEVGSRRVEAIGRRPDGTVVARLALSFTYQVSDDG